MEGQGKRLLNFLLLKPAFTGRNLFSIFLVMMFVGVYIASGGRVHTIPKIKPGGQFGTVEQQVQPERQPVFPPVKDLQKSIFGNSEQPENRPAMNPEDINRDGSVANKVSPAERLEQLRQKLKQQNQKNP